MGALDRRLSVAPMMDWTDRHCRYFLRLISQRTLLYTEMVHANAVLQGDTDRLLAFDPAEQPLAVQLGGSDPELLGQAARLCAERGFVEVNLNVGCPSDRVQAGRFGACLMAEPELVAECVAAIREAVAQRPSPTAASRSPQVTVKTRIGIDGQDDFDFLARFIERQVTAGCQALILHARKAWLTGLSPKENREVPPLDYGRVLEVRAAFPELPLVLNGGVRSLEEAEAHLARDGGVDGVMLGRAAYHDPWCLAGADRRVFGETGEEAADRAAVVQAYRDYVARELAAGARLHHLTRHILGLYQGRPGARRWRRALTEGAHSPAAGLAVLDEALESVALTP